MYIPHILPHKLTEEIFVYINDNSVNLNHVMNTYIVEFEDTKGVIKIRKSKTRHHNGQKKKYKRTNNDLQDIHIKLKMGVNSGAAEG